MPTLRLFRLSTYLTLGSSFVALAYAEWIFVPEATVLLGLLCVLLTTLYLYEERLALSLRGANRWGAVLGVIGFGWLAWVTIQPGSGLLENLPWSLRIMPYFGPVLAAVLPAKLLRPGKHAGDYFAFYAASLCLVALATAMEEDSLFLGLVALYLIVLTWSLVLFSTLCLSGRIPPLPWLARGGDGPRVAVSEGGPPPSRYARPREFLWALASLVLAFVLALPPFMLTPRTGGPVWDFAGRRLEVGFAADQLLDLNRTGRLHLSSEPAFEVEVRDAQTGALVDGLPAETRWRSLNGSFVQYKNGTWPPREPIFLGAMAGQLRLGGMPEPDTDYRPPWFGPGTVEIRYTVPTFLRTILLVDPIQWDPRQHTPLAAEEPGARLPWAIRSDGAILPAFMPRARRGTITYQQRIQPDVRRIHSPPFEPLWDLLNSPAPLSGNLSKELQDYADHLRFNPVPGIRSFTEEVIAGLAADETLPPAMLQDRDPATGWFPPRHHQALAETLRDYLRYSGQFLYSYQIRRQNSRMDPIEDFLKNTREGHCERFASALVLMLRSLGIPAQFVLGFRGLEWIETGRYLIRQDHAHAWVEALVPDPEDPSHRRYRWLSLDPTPSLDDLGDEAMESWWQRVYNRGKEMLLQYVIGYDTTAREKVLTSLSDRGTWFRGLVMVALGGLGLLSVRWAGRKLVQRCRQRRSDRVFGYDALQRVLRPLGLEARPGQTPGELAAEAQQLLERSPHTAPLADVPPRWVQAYYAVRFGGETLSSQKRTELQQSLDALRRAIRQGV